MPIRDATLVRIGRLAGFVDREQCHGQIGPWAWLIQSRKTRDCRRRIAGQKRIRGGPESGHAARRRSRSTNISALTCWAAARELAARRRATELVQRAMHRLRLVERRLDRIGPSASSAPLVLHLLHQQAAGIAVLLCVLDRRALELTPVARARFQGPSGAGRPR